MVQGIFLLSLFQGIQVLATGMEMLASPAATTTPLLLLDPNRARLPELMLLPGIGRQRAEAIILHRIRNGPFRCVEDLAEIPGLGPQTLAQLSAHLRVDDGDG